MSHNDNSNRRQSRGAVSVEITAENHIATLRNRADDLEQRLALAAKEMTNSSRNSGMNNTDHDINKYRTKLCEVLADWLLTDPATAATHDVVGRLWRHCFYARVGPERARISKEKRKAEKSAGAVHYIAKLQESLQVFLGEGINLYEFICHRLQETLLVVMKGNVGSGEQPLLNQASQDSNASKATLTSAAGIIPCLNRLYISWGDLYRYGDYYQKAEWAYTMAARLGPGSGHAYNQLAVVSQIKHGNQNQSVSAAITVYWYARSLAAVTEPFPTAISNLQRLWVSNASWLKEQREKQSSSTIVLAGNASRMFLSQLVNLQFNLLEDGKPSSEGSGNGCNDATFYNDLRETSQAFRELLQSSALGDGLLCKLVVIVAFTEFYCRRESAAFVSNENWVAARMLTLNMGQRMAERVTQTLQTKLKPGQTTFPSIRVLLPLLLLLEYLLHASDKPDVSDVDVDIRDQYKAGERAFWVLITDAFNVLQNLVSLRGDAVNLQLKEYQEFRGFAPFETFLNDRNVTESGHLTDEAASEERFLIPASNNGRNEAATQESARNSQASGGTAGNDSAHAIKLQRLLSLRPKVLEIVSTGFRVRENSTTQSLELVDVVEEHLSDDHMHDNNDTVLMDDGDGIVGAVASMNENAGSDDLLVYKQSEFGGPALLTPGALLLDQPSATNLNIPPLSGAAAQSLLKASISSPSKKTATPNEQQDAESMQVDGTAVALNLQSLMAHDGSPAGTGQVDFGVLPPPGFASRQQQHQDPMAALLAGHGSQSQPAAETHIAPSFFMNLGLPDAATMPSHGPTIGESLDLFGGPSALQTANPFATESLPSFGMGSYIFPQSDAAFLVNQDSVGLDGTSLLDSSLLSSLLMDDSTQKAPSRNPFAT